MKEYANTDDSRYETMKTTTLTLTVLVLAAGITISGTAMASQEIAEQEQMVCTACHDKPGSRLLTDQGKYYEWMGTVDGYDEIEAAFENCTSCHVRKPGSKKLTKTGQHFAVVVGNMEGLRNLLHREQEIPCVAEAAEAAGPEEEEPKE